MRESQSSPASPRPLLRWLVFALKVAVALGILIFLLRKAGGQKVWSVFSRLDWRLFVVAVLGYCCMQALSAFRLQVLLRAIGATVPYLRVLVIYFIGMFFNTVLPTIVGGDAVRIAYLYRETRQFGQAVASTLTERVVGVSSLITIALTTLVLSYRQHAGTRVIYSVLAVSAFFIAGMIVVLSPWVYGIAVRCARATGLGRLLGVLEKVQSAIAVYRRRHDILAVTMLLSLGVQLIVIGVYTLLAYGLGLRLPFSFLLMAVPVTVLVSMAPVTVSGLGVRELSWVFLLGQRGVPQADAVALSLTWFLVVTVSSALGGPAFVLWRKQRQPERHPATDPECINHS